MSTRDAAATLAEFIAGVPSEALSERTIEAAKLDLIDTLACAAAGLDALAIPELVRLARSWGGAPESSIWYRGLSVPMPVAAFVNGSTAHALDYDDTHDRAVLHAGVTVIPSALAAAEHRGTVSGKDLLGAIVVGVEVACRLGTATRKGPGISGWLLTPVCGTFGAAAAASRALGLDVERTHHALGIAYAQAAGNGQATLDGAHTKRLQAGFAARAGSMAAVLAANGITGAQDVFEGPRGFYNVYHEGEYNASALTENLGETYEIEALSYKPYPCCRWTHTSLEAALELRPNIPSLGDVDTIEVLVNEQAYNSTGRPIERKRIPRTVVDAQFSIPYVVAVALSRGEIVIDDFTEAGIGRADVLELAGKVSVRPAPDHHGATARNVSPADVTVRLRSGRTLHQVHERPSGGPDASLPVDRVRKKFLECLERSGCPRSQAVALLDNLSSLESRGDVTGLLAGWTAADSAFDHA